MPKQNYFNDIFEKKAKINIKRDNTNNVCQTMFHKLLVSIVTINK
jgi:hypothetical protein